MLDYYYYFTHHGSVVGKVFEHKTYSPQRSPFPHSHVLWSSSISLSWSTLKLAKSFSFISFTAIASRGVVAKDRLGSHCGRNAVGRQLGRTNLNWALKAP